MTTLRFTIRFHTPFAVTSGHSSDGIDARVDFEELLPATSLKGLIRAEAAHELGVRPSLVRAIFGGVGPRSDASPWAWSDARFDPSVTIDRRARLKIEDEGRAGEGSLLIAEQVWATRAAFEVTRMRPLPDEELGLHRLVIRAAARSVTSLGAGRRRGQGWVSIVDDADWTVRDTEDLGKLIGADRD